MGPSEPPTCEIPLKGEVYLYMAGPKPQLKQKGGFQNQGYLLVGSDNKGYKLYCISRSILPPPPPFQVNSKTTFKAIEFPVAELPGPEKVYTLLVHILIGFRNPENVRRAKKPGFYKGVCGVCEFQSL